MGDQSAASRFLELSEAISELRDRGLHQSVRWAAEQLVGLSDGASDAAAAQRMERACQVPDHPKFVLARSYFDVKVNTLHHSVYVPTVCMCFGYCCYCYSCYCVSTGCYQV